MTKTFKGTSLLATFLMVATALPVLAQTTSTGATSTATSTPSQPTVNVSCVQAAIDKRDNAVIAAVNAYHAVVISALQTRRDALKAAWVKTDPKERRTALRAAWKAYSNAVRKARKDFREARKAAWKQFKTDRRACGGETSEPGGGEGQDENL